MKGKLLILMMTLLLAVPSFAQKKHDDKNRDERRKEMMEFKLKFISEEIELKENQKKEFDTVYMQMEQERRSILRKIRAAEKQIKENPNASEADYERANDEIQAAKAEMTQVEKKFDTKFATFLTKKQMYKMKEAETKFMETARKCRDKKKN